MFDLTGKKALITGATGGIGRAIAEAFHAQGATIAISGTRENVLQELADSLGSNVHVVPCNLSDKDSIEALVPSAIKAMGGVDILINNAGITRDGLFMRMKDDDWDAVISVNLTAAMRLSRAVMRGMMKARHGRIINISSVVGVAGNPGQANYVASKAAIIGLGKSLAQEVGNRGITVNAIAPGFIATPMTDELNEKQTDAILANIPSKRLGTAQEIASAAVYLASDEAAYVTGQTLHVNGGMLMV
ncbi:MAG: 3-oxoacyl-[acyl-carrier-protein] reductase [Rhizobiales bacterium]|nr:3-oxoacyl-[acyl-carrier-protein] reductase [Hyphomicrobiales bacterium]